MITESKFYSITIIDDKNQESANCVYENGSHVGYFDCQSNNLSYCSYDENELSINLDLVLNTTSFHIENTYLCSSNVAIFAIEKNKKEIEMAKARIKAISDILDW
ncbi:TPA: hypothetical protein ACPZRX_002003 [Yersinia enterocolitica]|uniref:Uncharacterized protein n=1 Tax=Yersinia intermedia TaxID=631 RepID=A0ABX6F5J0_YERIN|nr:hypothetical protein [Yersinia intermedia]HDL6695318.1 hypothetical protein [Yersinia enterocolitica]QGR64639.1 hypothetical protein FOC38_00985 [Yersinia intermedia]QGR69655.1 hypothetical protein FOC37_04290 [Yersinia intermedia]CNJ91863.1 Uncharacterised protein [Yersinia intermedia]HDU2632211.1 hypothetical protein [Yersinia enterocolitica]